MIPRRFPFQWGAGPATAPVPPTPVPPVWTRITAAGSWSRGIGATRTPRFEHVYAQAPGGTPYRNQDLVHRVQTQYPFVISTGNAVVVASHLSSP